MHQTYPSFPLTTTPPPPPPLAKQHVANEHPSFFYTYLKTPLRRENELAASNFIACKIPSRSIRQKRRIFLELNSKGLHRSSGKEKENNYLVSVHVLRKTRK